MKFLPFVPLNFGPVLFQYGMHPYVNIFLSLTVGSVFLLKWLWNPNHLYIQSRIFKFEIVIVVLFLLLITFLQTFFVNTDESFYIQMGAAVVASFMLFLFGRAIPTSLAPEKFLFYLRNITVALCWISFVLLLVSSATVFKGTRFVGVFKHIPHMVSVSTLACFAQIYFFIRESQSKRRLLINSLHFSMAFMTLILTGTRSALASVVMGLVLAAILFPAKQAGTRIIKFALIITITLSTLFFGEDAGRYAVEIARGEKGLAGRSAQDGISSRLQEVERGFEIFLKNQWLGQGLVSKFSSGSDADVTGYNANKDPHNIFVSAGVIGGWGLIALTLLLLTSLIVAALKTLRSKNSALKIIAIYVLTQVPLLVIYHLHFSIGGIADRIYWIVFGYMALKERDVEKDIT